MHAGVDSMASQPCHAVYTRAEHRTLEGAAALIRFTGKPVSPLI